MLINILLLIAGLVALVMGGESLVRGASSLAIRIHLSPLVVGLTIVAFGTSAPELLISLSAAIGGSPDIATGNVVGSNICNLALVLGITVLIGPVHVNRNSIQIDWPVTMGASLLFYLFVLNHTLSRLEGFIMFGLLIAYTSIIIWQSRKKLKAARTVEVDLDVPDTPSASRTKDIILIILGSIGLYFGAQWFVTGAKALALFLDVSQRVVGITVVALGTSLPELVTAIVASFKKETDLAVGNLLGSNIFNILSILGITSMVKPIQVNELILKVDMLWMLGITFLILPPMLIRRKLGKLEGVVLLSIYVYYIYSVIL